MGIFHNRPNCFYANYCLNKQRHLKRYYLDNRYGSGDGPEHDLSYDYLLFRQDWSGQESIFFNKEDMEEFCDKIDSGDIQIDKNYSLLYCKNEARLEEIRDKFGCYELLMPRKG